DGNESHPDEKVADVKRVSGPGEDPVGDKSLNTTRAAASDGAGRGDARETDGLTDDDQCEPDLPAERRRRARHYERDAEEQEWQPSSMTEQHRADLSRKRLLGGADSVR